MIIPIFSGLEGVLYSLNQPTHFFWTKDVGTSSTVLPLDLLLLTIPAPLLVVDLVRLPKKLSSSPLKSIFLLLLLRGITKMLAPQQQANSCLNDQGHTIQKAEIKQLAVGQYFPIIEERH